MVPAVGPPPVEPTPDSGSKKSSKRRRKSSRKSKEKNYKEYSDSEEDIKSSKGLKKPKSMSSSSRISPRSGATTTKPNTSAYGGLLDTGGNAPNIFIPQGRKHQTLMLIKELNLLIKELKLMITPVMVILLLTTRCLSDLSSLMN